MQQQQKSRTYSPDELNDSSLSRVLIHSAEQISEHTLPLSIIPSSSSSLITTTRCTNSTQTTQDIQSSFTSKSIPSFAETQLLSVYYPNQNPINSPINDRCIFVEQQNRQPIRYRTTYDPLSSTTSTQTSPPSTPLSTHGSTLIVNGNQQLNSTYDQHLKIHSGNRHLSNNINDEHSSPNELIEESKYSYEEYIIHVDHNQTSSPSSSSSSSVTTVIAQNEEIDSDHTSRLSFDGTNSQSSASSISINHEKPIIINNQSSTTRISSWPPVPDDIFPADNQFESSMLNEIDQQQRSSRVQFAEQLVHIIPPSITSSLSDESLPLISVNKNSNEQNRLTGVDPRLVREQLQRLDYHPINQSKWIKDHMDISDIKTNTVSNRVDALRSLFEQEKSTRSSDSSTLNSPINQIRRIEPEEKLSKYGDEIRFHINQSNTSSVYHAEPAKVIQNTSTITTNPSNITPLTWEALVGVPEEHLQRQSLSLFKLDQIRQITGKQIKSLDEIGHYLQDRHTWQWNETFWLSLTPSQRDQLKYFEQQSYSHQNNINYSSNQDDSELSTSVVKKPISSNETKRFQSTINTTGAEVWQENKEQTTSVDITKSSETNPSLNIFALTPSTSNSRIGSEESIASSINQQQTLRSSKRSDSQITIIESGYSSSDEPQQQQQQRINQFRPNSSTIIEESSSHHIDTNNTIIKSNNSHEQPIFENLRPEIRQQINESEFDSLSYEQFIYDYLSTYAKHLRSNDGTLILFIDGQQIHMSHIHLPSNDNLILEKNIYLDAINEYPLPFETESDQLIIFIHNESIVLSTNRWLFYKRKYNNAEWIKKLHRVNRNIPTQLIPIIEQWLADHATFLLDTNEVNVDGLIIPLIGRLGLHLLDLYKIRQLQTNYWNEVLKYLIHIGYVSYDSDEKLLHIAHSELDARRLLTSQSSFELIERLATLLRSLNHIHFNNENGTLILNENFLIPNEYISDLFEKHKQKEILNANELARLLLHICDIDEDNNDQSLILTLNGQSLRLNSSLINQENERILFIESISSLLYFSTIELIEGYRLRLSLNENSSLSDKSQQIEFNENDTNKLCLDLDLDINACTKYLIDHIFDKIEFDNENKSLIIIYYHEQILRLKTFKEKLIQSKTKKLQLILKKNLNKNHINILTNKLEQLNEEKLIIITQQNDIIIFPNNKNDQKQQQIFINHHDVDLYMKTKLNTIDSQIINMNDIANILIIYNYVQYSSDQLIFGNQCITLDKNEVIWLQSIIRNVRSIEHIRETEVELFDGEHTEILRIPYEHMPPTNDSFVVANYLFRNGNVRYDAHTENYAYRYIIPNIPLDKRNDSAERIGQQHELLSSHIRHIHIDDNNERIEIEFIHDENRHLQLSSRWYHQALEHNFDHSYIIDMLLTNGGIIDHNIFTFNGQSYSLEIPPVLSSINLQTEKLSSKEKEDLIDHYVEYIINQDGIKYDKINHFLVLENPSDGSQLYLIREHSEFIHQNQYRREDVKHLLVKHSQIKQDEFDNWLLYYNNQCIQIPSLNNLSNITHLSNQSIPIIDENNTKFLSQETQAEFLNRYHQTINYMYHNDLITCNKRLKFIQIHCSNQILTIPIEQLRSIIDMKILNNSSNENILPFNSNQLSQWLLNKSNRINNSSQGYIQLTYKNKLYCLPLINFKNQSKIDPKLKLLFPFNTSLRLIQKTPSTSTLDIQPPNAANGYAIDPLLMLANYIYRAGTIYQDELGRLVIKMSENEIVVPRIDAINAIESINTSPRRTGTIIARLIHRIGKVESNKAGGLIITIGKSSFELSKELIDRSNKNDFILQNQNLNNSITLTRRKQTASPILPLLQHSKSTGNLSSSTTIEHSWLTDDQQIRYSKDGRGDARYLNLNSRTYIDNNPKKSILIDDLTRLNPDRLNRRKSNDLENDHTHVQTSLCSKPRLLIIPDYQTTLTSNRQTRFYVQYNYEHDTISNNNSTHVMMLPSRYPIRPTQPQLIAPDHYRDIALREASVYVYTKDKDEIYYENLAQYLSINQSDISSRTVRRMLKFSSRDEYFTYLSTKMSSINAEQLVKESEKSSDEPSSRYINITTRTDDDDNDSISSRTYYNVQNGITINEEQQQQQRSINNQNRYNFSSKFVERSSSTSSLDSDMLITNTFPLRRTILGNNTSSNIPILNSHK